MDSSLIRRLVTTHLRPIEGCLQPLGPAGATAAEAVVLSGCAGSAKT